MTPSRKRPTGPYGAFAPRPPGAFVPRPYGAFATRPYGAFAPRALDALVLAILVCASMSCGGPRTVSRDGYRANLVYSSGEKYRIAARGEWKRVEGVVDGVPLVKIERPDLKKAWQFRADTKRIVEQVWSPTDEIVPGYPLDPRFDSQAYAARFHARIRKVPDAAFAGHPCDRYEMDLPSGDRVQIWAARDLERLVIRLQHERKKAEDEFEPAFDVQLTEIRIGADPDLFQKPKAYSPAASYEDLKKAKG